MALTAFRLPDGAQEFTTEIEIVDQLLLPHTVRWLRVSTISRAFDAIKRMQIRGAPAIASLAALALAAELRTLVRDGSSEFFASMDDKAVLTLRIKEAADLLLRSRPTAVNLREAMERVGAAAQEGTSSAQELAEKVANVGVQVWLDDRERNITMGDHGARWILGRVEKQGRMPPDGKITTLTVCNTGSLATSGYGTALGVITSLHKMGRLAHAFFAQTGPYQQGARLTALELASLKIPSTMVCDTAIGALLAEKDVHLFVAGADRIAANGDTANKVSTFQIATLCKHLHPFSPNHGGVSTLVAAPVTTLDLKMTSGRSIVIEQRPQWEACTAHGRVVDPAQMSQGAPLDAADVQTATVLVTPPGTQAWNPAFDVTPASLIDGIVTELGVASASGPSGEYDLPAYVNKSAST